MLAWCALVGASRLTRTQGQCSGGSEAFWACGGCGGTRAPRRRGQTRQTLPAGGRPAGQAMPVSRLRPRRCGFCAPPNQHQRAACPCSVLAILPAPSRAGGSMASASRRRPRGGVRGETGVRTGRLARLDVARLPMPCHGMPGSLRSRRVARCGRLAVLRRAATGIILFFFNFFFSPTCA